jgi:hypothetical protein
MPPSQSVTVCQTIVISNTPLQFAKPGGFFQSHRVEDLSSSFLYIWRAHSEKKMAAGVVVELDVTENILNP